MPFRSELLAFAALAVAARAAATVAIQAAGLTRPSVAPGRVVTLSWNLANDGDEPLEGLELVCVPEGWQRVGPATLEVALAPHQRQLCLVAARVPQQAAVGPHEVSCELRRRDGTLVARSRSEVCVLPQHRLELIAEAVPDLVVAGDTYQVRVAAVNRGNEAVRLRLSAVSAPAQRLSVAPEQLLLEPGRSATISVTAVLPGGLAARTLSTLQVTATPDLGAEQTCTVQTPLLPGAARDPGSVMDATVSTSVVRESTGRWLWRGELSGTDPVGQEAGRSLSYLLRGPDTRSAPLFLEPGQLSAEYRQPGLDLRAGDGDYALSPLTTLGAFARGAGFDAGERDGLRYGAFADRARFQDEDAKAAGMYLGAGLAPGLDVRGNLFVKEVGPLQAFGGSDVGTASAEATFDPGRALHLEVEAGLTLDPPRGSRGSAMADRLCASGASAGSFSYHLDWEEFGARYFGALRDARLWDLGLERHLLPWLCAHVEAREEDYTDPHSLPLQLLNRNHELAGGAGLVARSRGGFNVGIDLQLADRGFGFASQPTRYREDSVRFSAGRSFDKVGVQAYAEVGRMDALEPASRQAPIERGGLSLTWQLNGADNLSVYASEGNDPYSSVGAHTTSLGTSIGAALGQKVDLTGQVGENLYDSTIARRRSYAFCSLRLRLPDRQSLGLRAGWFQPQPGADGGLTVAATYSKTLSLPRLGAGLRGTVSGFVIDQSSHRPVRRVVLSLAGITAVTDERGRYEFSGLREGSYQLQVDAKSLRQAQMPAVDLPLAIDLARNEARKIDVPLARAGIVQVQVAALPSAEHPIGSLEAVLVELVRGRSVQRQLTDAAGRAVFSHVLPGDWHVRVEPMSLPSHTVVTMNPAPVDVGPEVIRRVSLELSYEAPKVRWLASTE